MSYDQRCYDLAQFFVEDSGKFLPGAEARRPAAIAALAQRIQDTIETELAGLDTPTPEAAGDGGKG